MQYQYHLALHYITSPSPSASPRPLRDEPRCTYMHTYVYRPVTQAQRQADKIAKSFNSESKVNQAAP